MPFSKKNIFHIKTLLFMGIFLLPSLAFAQEGAQGQTPRQKAFQGFLATLQTEMRTQGIDPKHFQDAIGQNFSIDEKAIERLHKQPEFTMTFAKYTKALVSSSRVKEGRLRFKKHHTKLQEISQKYGIPAEVIVSLWGVETFYGKWAGRHNIAQSLATLAFDSHRKSFFKKELFAAMRIVQEGHIGPQELRGSWAGALGQCQFMPTSFLAYSADGDGDGKKNIWHNEADVFASAANYLRKHGWQTDQRWGQRVVLSKILPALKLSERGLSGHKTVGAWAKLGVKAASSRLGLLDEAVKARLYIPEGPSGPAYLVYPNFDTVLDWNRSSFFAYSVLTLADKIAE